MAVLKKGQVANVSTDAEEAKKKGDELKGKVVDILQEEKKLPSGKKTKLDLEEDAWSFAHLPPAGRYSLKCMPAKDAVRLQYMDEDKPDDDEVYYTINIEAKIVSEDPEVNDRTVFSGLSTRIYRGKHISTAAGWLKKAGFQVPAEIDDRSLAVLCYKALQREKVVDAELDWQGYSKIDSRVAYKNMAAFPTDKEGNPQQEVEYITRDKTKEDIRAQLKVTHWYGKGEESKATPVAGGKGGVTQLKPVQAASEPEETGEEEAEGTELLELAE